MGYWVVVVAIGVAAVVVRCPAVQSSSLLILHLLLFASCFLLLLLHLQPLTKSYHVIVSVVVTVKNAKTQPEAKGAKKAIYSYP